MNSWQHAQMVVADVQYGGRRRYILPDDSPTAEIPVIDGGWRPNPENEHWSPDPARTVLWWGLLLVVAVVLVASVVVTLRMEGL